MNQRFTKKKRSLEFMPTCPHSLCHNQSIYNFLLYIHPHSHVAKHHMPFTEDKVCI